MRKYYIGESKIHKKGVLARRNIRKGETCFVFKGKRERFKRALTDWKEGPNWLQVGPNEWVIPGSKSSGRYLNHSCNPNAGIKGLVTIVAMKDIKKGEEITVDYSMSETEPQWRMKCNCGSKNCRKIIKPYQHLPEKLKKKYRKYISRYIQEGKN